MPVSKFGLSLKIVSDVYSRLPASIAKKKELYHLATVVGGEKEYLAYLDPKKNTVWIEEVYISRGKVRLKKIADDNEWSDLKDFLFDAKLLEIGSRKEIPVSEGLAYELGLLLKAKPKEI